MGKPLKLSDKNARWARPVERRGVAHIPERTYFLIVCEGAKTEPNYFRALGNDLPKGTVQVEVRGVGMNTLSLIEEALRLNGQARSEGRTVDKVWVVFDRDSFRSDDFDNAINKASSQGFGAAWSNEAFELWYLLHFKDRTSKMSRTDYKAQLTNELGRPYKKNDTSMYAVLKTRLADAIRRAEQLVAQHRGSAPHKANPCTCVYALIYELNNPESVRR